MASKWSYFFTQKAESDLEDILQYIAVELANPQAASDFADTVQKKIDEIRLFPESGSLVANEFLINANVRKKSVGNYIMYYLPDLLKKRILVLRIVYGKRNMDEILRRLDL